MANSQIGISFMPSAENSELGPQRGAAENPSSDLAQAFKILSLHLPRNLSPHAIASQSLLGGQGSAGVGAPGVNPFSQAFEAMIRAMLGQQGGYLPPGGPIGGGGATPSYTMPGSPMPGTSRPSAPSVPVGGAPKPRITPGEGDPLPPAPPPSSAGSSFPERPFSGGRPEGGSRRQKDGFPY
jgi:hypothetical protein